MHGGPAHSTIRLPIARLAAATIGSAAAVAALGALAAAAIPDAATLDGLWPGVIVLATAAAGVLFLALCGPRPAGAWAALTIGGSALRLGLSLAIAVLAYRAIGPERLVFWIVFLAASLAVMAAEVAVVTAALRTHAANLHNPSEHARA